MSSCYLYSNTIFSKLVSAVEDSATDFAERTEYNQYIF